MLCLYILQLDNAKSKQNEWGTNGEKSKQKIRIFVKRKTLFLRMVISNSLKISK